MTTNKPEIAAYLHTNKENPEHRGVSLHHDPNCTSTLINTEPLIRLSDYEALQAAEPVAFRFRSKRLTDEGINPTWIYEEGVPKVHDEILEGCYVELLFTLPCPPAKVEGEVVITSDPATGQCVAVTRQNEEGQILSVIWERPAKAQVPEFDKKLFDSECRESVAGALGLPRGGDYAWSYLLAQIKEAVTATAMLTASPAPEHSEQDLESLMSQHRIGLIPINTTDWKAFVYDETIGQDRTCTASSPKAALTTLFASLGPVQQEESER